MFINNVKGFAPRLALFSMASSDDQLRELVRGMEEDYLLVSVDEVVRHLDEVVDELRKEPSSCNAIHVSGCTSGLDI